MLYLFPQIDEVISLLLIFCDMHFCDAKITTFSGMLTDTGLLQFSRKCLDHLGEMNQMIGNQLILKKWLNVMVSLVI